MATNPSASFTTQELRRLLRAYRMASAEGRTPVGAQERVSSWGSVIAALRARQSTFDAVAILSPDDAVPVALEAQDGWPPAAPVVACDVSWILSVDKTGEPLLVWPARD